VDETTFAVSVIELFITEIFYPIPDIFGASHGEYDIIFRLEIANKSKYIAKSIE
jgi:hypothetical protein